MAERTGGGNILTVSPFNIKTLKCVCAISEGCGRVSSVVADGKS